MTEAVRGVSLRKVYGASVAIWLAALLVSLQLDSFAISAGLTAGFATSLGVLASWQFIVSQAFGAPAEAGAGRESQAGPAGHGRVKAPRRKLAIALAFLKIPLVGAVVYGFVGREWVSGPGFAAGFILPHAAIAVLAIGARSEARKEPAHAAPRA